jgi:hypothetical protein
MDVHVHDKTQTSPHVMACAIKPVYKGHSTYPENVFLNEQLPFIYRFKYMQSSLMENMKLSFIDTNLPYRCAP